MNLTMKPVDPKEAIISLMVGVVPERRDVILSLWERYDPDVIVVDNPGSVTLNATKDRIAFSSPKTMEVFWLIGFSGWRALECYAPAVVTSCLLGEPIADLLKQDQGLAVVERAYKERRAAAQTLIDAKDLTSAPWPPDLPRPNPDRSAFDNPEYRATFDLVLSAIGFTFFHEFHHVMLDRDGQRPQDRREEELACDVWARDFITARIAEYAKTHNYDYAQILRRRAMAFSLAGLILHEITPVWDHGGNSEYFSVASRLQTILDNTALPDSDPFWIQTASLLIGILRQKGARIDAPVMSAKALTRRFLEML